MADHGISILCIVLLTGTALAVIPGTVSEAGAQTTNLENAEITLLDPEKNLYRYTTIPVPKITNPEGYFENYYITDNSDSVTFTSTAHEFEFNKDTCSFTVRDGDGNTEIGNMEQKFYINSGDRWQDITPESCTVELTGSNRTHAQITASSDNSGVEFDVIFDIYYAGFTEWTYEMTNNLRDTASAQLGIVEICTDCTSTNNPFLNSDGTVSDPLAFRQAGLDDKTRKGESAPGKRVYDPDTIGDKLLSIGTGVYDPKNEQHGTLSAIRLDDNNMEVEFFGTQALPFGQTMVIDPSYTSGGTVSTLTLKFFEHNYDPARLDMASPSNIAATNISSILHIGYAVYDISSIPDDVIIHNVYISGNTHHTGSNKHNANYKIFENPLTRTDGGYLTTEQDAQIDQALASGRIYYSTIADQIPGNTVTLNNRAIDDVQHSIDNDEDTFGILTAVENGADVRILSPSALNIDYELVEHQLVIGTASAPRYLGVESPDNYNHALGSSWTVQDRSDGTFKVGNQDTRTLAGGIRFDVSAIGDNWNIDELAVGLHVLEVNDSTANFEFARGSRAMPDHTDWDGSPLSELQQTELDAFAYELTRGLDYTPAGSTNTVTQAGYHVFELNDRAKSDLEFSASRTTPTTNFAPDVFRPNIMPADSDTAWYMKVSADPPDGGTGIKPGLHINYSIREIPTGIVSNVQLANLAPVSDTEIDYTFTWDYAGSDPAYFAMEYTLDSGTNMPALTSNGDTFSHTIRAGYDIEQFQVRAVFSDGSNTIAKAIPIPPPRAVEIAPVTEDPLDPAQIEYGWIHNYADYNIPELTFKLEYKPDGGSIIEKIIDDANTLSYVISALPETEYEVRVSFIVDTNVLDTSGWSTITSGDWPTITSLTVDAIEAQSIDISFEFGEYSWLDPFVVMIYDSGSNLLHTTTVPSTDRKATITPPSPFPSGTITVSVTPYASGGLPGPTGETQFTPPPSPPQNLQASAAYDSVTISWDDPDDDSITGYKILRGTPSNPNSLDILAADTESTDTTFVDADITSGQTYLYVVTAINPSGESAKSDLVKVTTPSAVTDSFDDGDSWTFTSYQYIEDYSHPSHTPFNDYTFTIDSQSGNPEPSAKISGDGFVYHNEIQRTIDLRPFGESNLFAKIDYKLLAGYTGVTNAELVILDEDNNSIYSSRLNNERPRDTGWQTSHHDITDAVAGHDSITVKLGVRDAWIADWNQIAYFDNFYLGPSAESD